MLILEGGVRFLVNLILLKTLSFYGLSPDQCLSNFYRLANCVIRLNNLYCLELNHHNINFMYSIRGSIKINPYLKIHNPMTRLISCLPNPNRNSTGKFIKVSRNWLVGELTCPISPWEIDRYSYISSTSNVGLIKFVLSLPTLHKLLDI